ncbi:hypothetical protein ACS0TY_024517 [Phlomoides rotata]
MSSFDSQRQESLKRMWQERRAVSAIDERFKRSATSSALYNYKLANNLGPTSLLNPNKAQLLRPSFSGGFNDDLVAAVIPPVTVVLDGRSICQRISLHKHGSYQSLARALKQMFVDINDQDSSTTSDDHRDVDLSNAVPGHIIAYEDMENDLLLVGDLNWKDFVRVAKRIRIIPVKAKSRKLKRELMIN